MTNQASHQASQDRAIFVFGSNLAGRHGKGAALHARNHYGAVYGIGVGRTGHAYAIPTKDAYLKTLPLDKIAAYVADFIAYAKHNSNLTFEVTRIGCGLAGYSDEQIAPMFENAPENCMLPDGWRGFRKAGIILGVFETLPKSERAFLKRCKQGDLLLTFRNDNGHPCEYVGYDKQTGKAIGMIKFYRGRLLASYTIESDPEPGGTEVEQPGPSG